MRRTFPSLLVVLAVVVLCATVPAQNVQKDPQNRFAISTPVGWKVVTTDDKMKLTMGDSFINITHVSGQNTAFKVLQAALGQGAENLQGGQELERGETTFGGEHAVYVNFSAYDDRSIAMYGRVVANDSGWVFFAGSPQTGFSTLLPIFLKIEHSFQLTKDGVPQRTLPPPPPPEPVTTPK